MRCPAVREYPSLPLYISPKGRNIALTRSCWSPGRWRRSASARVSSSFSSSCTSAVVISVSCLKLSATMGEGIGAYAHTVDTP